MSWELELNTKKNTKLQLIVYRAFDPDVQILHLSKTELPTLVAQIDTCECGSHHKIVTSRNELLPQHPLYPTILFFIL